MAPQPASTGSRPQRGQVLRDLVGDARRLLAVAWREAPGRVVKQMVLLVLAGGVGGAGLVMLAPIVNTLADPAGGGTLSLPLVGTIDLAGMPIALPLGLFVMFTAAQAAIQRASSINAVTLNQTVVDRLRGNAFDAILGADWGFILERQRADIVTVVATGAARSGSALSQLLNGAVTLTLALVTAMVAILVQPALAGVAVTGTFLLGVLLATSFGPAYSLGRLFGERTRVLQAVMTDSLDSLRLVRAHDAADVWRSALAEAFQDARQVQIENARRTSTISAAGQTALAAAAAGLIVVAVAMDIPATTIAVVVLLTARLSRYVQMLANTVQIMANALPAVRDIEDLTTAALAAAEVRPEAAASVTDACAASGASETPSIRAAATGLPLVAMDHVTFRYPTGTGGLTDVSFEVPLGRMTALVGESGAGKSTTADIVLGLLPPASGEVRIAGRPLTRAGLADWRRGVAYVPQETVLIPGSVRRNLVWSVGDVSDADCWAALDRASATFVRDLPKGLDTVLGDRGVRLSGGERQRIAIARALLRRPQLLVLDEATSALDDRTEAAVLDLLTSLTPAMTVLVIAHRRSTIEAADQVVELRAGRVLSR